MRKTPPAITLAIIMAASWPVAAQERAGVVTTAEGPVTVNRSAGTTEPLKFKDNVFVQDTVATGDRALARMLLGGKAVVTVREFSTITITEVPGKSIVDISSGKMSLSVARERMRPGEVIDIRTPNAVVSVRGTVVVAEVGRAASGEITSGFTVMRGTVDVNRIDASRTAVGPPVQVGLQQRVDVDGSQATRPIPAAQAVPPAGIQRINQEFPPKFNRPPATVTSGLVAPGQVTQATILSRQIVAAQPVAPTPTTPPPGPIAPAPEPTTTETPTTNTPTTGTTTPTTPTTTTTTTTPTTTTGTATTTETTEETKGRHPRKGPQSDHEVRGRAARDTGTFGVSGRSVGSGDQGRTDRIEQTRVVNQPQKKDLATNFVTAPPPPTPKPPTATVTPTVSTAVIGKQVIQKVLNDTVDIRQVFTTTTTVDPTTGALVTVVNRGGVTTIVDNRGTSNSGGGGGNSGGNQNVSGGDSRSNSGGGSSGGGGGSGNRDNSSGRGRFRR
jgi:hypothetical protein